MNPAACPVSLVIYHWSVHQGLIMLIDGLVLGHLYEAHFLIRCKIFSFQHAKALWHDEIPSILRCKIPILMGILAFMLPVILLGLDGRLN